MDRFLSKNILVLAPDIPAESLQELLDTFLLPTQKDLEVLLPPEKSNQYEFITNRKNIPAKVKFVNSPARSFFSAPHLKWLKAKLGSSANVMVFLKNSPYEDLTSAMVSLLIMLMSGGTITLLRAFFSEHQPIIDGKPHDTTLKWISKELNLKALGKEFVALIPNMWEILYFFMFLSLVIKKVVADKFSSACLQQETEGA